MYRQLSIDSNTGMGIIPDLTQNLNIISSCSSDFTITQDIEENTLVNLEDNFVVTITATDELGQVAQCFITVSTDPVLSTENPSIDQDIKLFPNPTQGTITLQNNNNIPLTEVVIYDSMGRMVSTKQINGSSITLPLSLEAYTEGIYFIRIRTHEASTIKRIVKQ